jgi:lysophospholipase L1-like esterase
MIKPFHIFAFGLSVIAALFCISFITPEGSWNFGGLKIHIPSYINHPVPVTKKYKDISQIIKFGRTLDSTVTSKSNGLSIPNNQTKGLAKDSTYVALNTDSIKGLLRPLEYPKGNDTLLYPFFEELQQLPSDKKLIHILHYGDSQIEGDRITSYLRTQFQRKFGGEGIGLFPIVATNPSSIPYNYDISGNWTKYSLLDNSTKAPHNKFGVLNNYFRIGSKSGLFAKKGKIEGWINLKQANTSNINAQQFSTCQIYYGFNTSPMFVELKQNKTLLDADIVPPSNKLSRLTWNFNKPEKNITITFKTDQSPDFFGISLTGNSGIIFDNIPLRGSSGLEFIRTNHQFLSEFFKLLNVKLLIMQFGVNTVPNVTNSYGYYEKSFFKQLEFLKQANPAMQIIVIGVSDVARNGENGFESYPNIEKIRDAQKMAAFKAGCAFWDMYEAMGGKNSMPSWVFANPPLAQKDFVHLNPAGARIIGEMFFRSLIGEFEKYSLNHKKTKA